MKKYILHVAYIALCAIGFGFSACKTSDSSPAPVVLQTALPEGKTAISAIINGIAINRQPDGIKWFVNTSRSIFYQKSIVKGVNYKISLSTNKGESYIMQTPLISIADPLNIPNSFNYQMLKNLFTLGKKEFYQYDANSTSLPYKESYGIMAYNSLNDNFGGNSTKGEQAKSSIEIIEVREIMPEVLLIKYKINCRLYGESGNYKTDFNGIFQVAIPFEELL
jgi:hypothetical protein